MKRALTYALQGVSTLIINQLYYNEEKEICKDGTDYRNI